MKRDETAEGRGAEPAIVRSDQSCGCNRYTSLRTSSTAALSGSAPGGRGRANGLNHDAIVQFTIAALHVVSLFGDERAEGAVYRLARDVHGTAANGQIRAAAVNCLEHLRQRKAMTEKSRNLLRAAETPDAAALLRAASGAASGDSASLLQAMDGNAAD